MLKLKQLLKIGCLAERSEASAGDAATRIAEGVVKINKVPPFADSSVRFRQFRQRRIKYFMQNISLLRMPYFSYPKKV